MKCPECSKAISEKDYDADYEWYECPGCEGCFTEDELVRTRKPPKSSAPKAKGKKRQENIDAEQEAIAEFEKKSLEPTVKQETGTKHRDEISTKQVVNIMADEIQEIYHEFGGEIDEANARDKALTIWRDTHIHAKATAREKAVEHALCGAHDG